MLDDNGLTDKGMSHILEGLNAQKNLESINITNNELGPLSLEIFQEIFDRMHISELRLSKIKFANTRLISQTMRIIADGYHLGLLALKLTDINLHYKSVFEPLLEIVSKNKGITDFNVENTGLLPIQLQELTEVLKSECKNLKLLNLSNNPIQQKFQEENSNIVANLQEII